MRGLKLVHIKKGINIVAVASFTDAWIETFFEVSALIFFVSHLLQMRGLKLAIKDKRIIASMSHLLQMRGLKQKKKVR